MPQNLHPVQWILLPQIQEHVDGIVAATKSREKEDFYFRTVQNPSIEVQVPIFYQQNQCAKLREDVGIRVDHFYWKVDANDHVFDQRYSDYQCFVMESDRQSIDSS